MRRSAPKLLLAMIAALVLSAGIATAAETETLETENLFAPAETFSSTSSCDTDGTSTVSWTASGIATGPYPGTFTASGSLTIGPQTLPGRPPGPGEGTFAGPILTFQETFIILSGPTTITGTKTLHPQATGTATCQQVTNFPVLTLFDGQGTVVEGGTQTRYAATISGPLGSSTDSGDAAVSLSDINITGSCPAGPTCQARLAGFSQTFVVSDGTDECDEGEDNNNQGDDDCQGEDEDEDEQ
jgi:hypothetical protein